MDGSHTTHALGASRTGRNRRPEKGAQETASRQGTAEQGTGGGAQQGRVQEAGQGRVQEVAHSRARYTRRRTAGHGAGGDSQQGKVRQALTKLRGREDGVGAERAILPYVGHLQLISTLKIGDDFCQLCQYKLTKPNLS